MKTVGYVKSIIDVNPYDFMSKPKRIWILYIDVTEPFGRYPTKAAALKDAEKYGIVIH